MNDLQKAQSLIFNRKIRLKTISQMTGIAYPTIRSYVVNPDKMRTAAWERINSLAHLYDKLNADEENNQQRLMKCKKIYLFLQKYLKKVVKSVYKLND